MTVWRGLQRYVWRNHTPKQVQWSYLVIGLALFGILYVNGTLGGLINCKLLLMLNGISLTNRYRLIYIKKRFD